MEIEQQLSELQKKYQEIEHTNQSLSGRLNELFILYNISHILITTFDFDQTMQRLFNLFKESMSVDHSSLFLIESLTNKFNLNKTYGFSKSGNAVIYPEQEIIETIILKQKPIKKTFFTKTSLASGQRDYLTFPIQFIGFPLIFSDHKSAGTLNFFKTGITVFSPSEIDFLKKISQEVGNMLDKIILFHQTREDTLRDPLTGAYNRRYFTQRLAMEIKRAERYKRNLSLLILDIDDFKEINDQYGHIQGDNVLKKLVHILKNNLRTSDILARYGGEEFVAILPETNAQNGYLVCEKLRKEIVKNLKITHGSKNLHKITVSIGMANFPADAYSAESLLNLSDKRLYFAKRKGKNCTVNSEINLAVV